MTSKVKELVFDCIYWLYQHRISPNRILVYSIDETIDALLNSDKSLVRFGDGEIRYIEGKSGEFQAYDKKLAEALGDILQFKDDRLLVGIPDIFDSLDMYIEKSRRFWKEHLYFSRKTYEKYCVTDKTYYNAFITRPFYMSKDKKLCENWIEKIKRIWRNKPIVIVEGAVSHNGVGNDLFSSAAKIYRIICPSCNAYAAYDQILKGCLSFPKDALFLTSVGMAAKLLTKELVDQGYRAIDIGNLDMEYDWYLQGAETKVDLQKHHCLSEEDNRKAGYYEYLDQIVYNFENL